MSEQALETRVALAEDKIQRHEQLFSEIHDTLKEVNKNLREQAAHERDRYYHSQALERAFTRIESMEGTLDGIKQEMPTLKMSRRAIFGVLGIGGAGALTLVIKAVQLATGG